jgi:pantoate kinase
VLDAGVTATAEWRPGPFRRIRIISDLSIPLPISEAVARRLAGSAPGALTVRLAHALPVGQGFGLSAAGATATALSVAHVTRCPRARAIEVAHLADLFGGGGLGGVAAILGGGLEVRVRPGIPPFGKVVHRPYPRPILLGVVGEPIATRSVLTRPRTLDRIATVAGRLDILGRRPDVDRFWDASEAFTDRVGLAPRPLRDLLRALRRRGARAAQAMFGRSFFASLPTGERHDEILRWMERRSLSGVQLHADARGARLAARAPESRSPP